jgi:hypothetical protein
MRSLRASRLSRVSLRSLLRLACALLLTRLPSGVCARDSDRFRLLGEAFRKLHAPRLAVVIG